MPILKKKTAASAVTKKATAAPTFKKGDQVMFLDTDQNEIQGEIIAINMAKKTATVDNAEATYEDVGLAELKPVEEASQEEAAPSKRAVKKGGGQGSSLSSIFRNAKMAPAGGGGGGSQFPEGDWEAILVEHNIEEKPDKVRITLTYVGVNDTDVEGVKHTVGYNYAKKQGDDWVEDQGAEFLKRDLNTLGVSEEDDREIEEILQGVCDDQPWVDVTSRQQKKDPKFNNLYVQGLKEDQESKPEVPPF